MKARRWNAIHGEIFKEFALSVNYVARIQSRNVEILANDPVE